MVEAKTGTATDLVRVARFTGSELRDITAQYDSYAAQHPGRQRDLIIQKLTPNKRVATQMEAGLDVLNQLKVVNRDWQDVHEITVSEDRSSIIRHGTARGKHHLLYDIAWIREPDPIPARQSERQAAPVTPKRGPTPEERAEQSRKDRDRNQRRKEAEEEKKRESARILWEREAIDEVIIDNARLVGQRFIENGIVTIELDEGNNALLFVKRHAFSDQAFPMDRETGKYDTAPGMGYTFGIRQMSSAFLNYFNVLAEQMEGKDTLYTPEPISPYRCKDAYDRALASGMLRITESSESGIQFEYVENPTNPYHQIYAEYFDAIDLDTNVVAKGKYSKDERPVHPDFAAFLREKKAELDTAGQSS